MKASVSVTDITCHDEEIRENSFLNQIYNYAITEANHK